jgi:hypothetical protein
MNHPDIVQVNNGQLISTKQGNNLKSLILEKKSEVKLLEISTFEKTIAKEGIEFMILSPTLEIKNELYRKWQESDLAEEEIDNDNIVISSHQDSHLIPLEDLSKNSIFP